MKCKTGSVWAGLIVVCLNLDAFGGVRENPYQIISEHNPFALRRPPAPLPIVLEIATIPLPEIKLTGVLMLCGAPYAILEVIDSRTKKTDRPPPFREGDVYLDDFQIVGIDLANDVVRIRRGGTETTLDFEKDGIKPATATATSQTLPPGVAGSLASQLPQENLQRRMTREEVAAHIERQRAIYQQQNDPVANILPPTSSGRWPDAVPVPGPR